jgi:hypothetical protein
VRSGRGDARGGRGDVRSGPATRIRRRALAALALGGIGACALLHPAAARAERPLDTEDTLPLEPGEVELELGADYGRLDGDRFGRAAGVLTVGLAPRLDGAVQSALVLLDPEGRPVRGGAGDSFIAFKYLVARERPRLPALLLSPGVRLPTADADRLLGTRGADVSLLAAASKTRGPLALTANVGYTFVTRERRRDFWTLAASIERHLSAAWEASAEMVAAVGHRDERHATLGRVGLAWVASERARLDAAVAAGIGGVAPDVLLTAGVTYTIF